MFENLKSLGGVDGSQMSLPMSVDVDAEGFIDRQCPARECEFLFKVYADDWSGLIKGKTAVCPFCGHAATSDQWNTRAQVEQAKRVVVAALKRRVHDALKRDAARWNRSQPRNAFISMTMRVEARPTEVVLPLEATNAMRLKISCPACACRYAVIGSAYFCPSCGHNAADFMFAQSLGTIRATLDNLTLIAAGLPDRDIAENVTRLLVEDSLQRIVTAFQRFAEALYGRQPSLPKVRRNLFQNLADGSAAWCGGFGAGYDAYLTPVQLDDLGRYFQQRHLLAHREGLVDADYIAKTGDQTYCEGQRLVIRETAVRHGLVLVETLATSLANSAIGIVAP